MNRNNLHLFLSDIVNETRLFKEAAATVEMGIFDSVAVVGTWEADLPTHQLRTDGMEVIRVRSWLKLLRVRYPKMKRGLFSKFLAAFGFLQYMLSAIVIAMRKKPTHISCHNLILLPVSTLAARISGAKLVYVPHELETERQGLKGRLKKLSAWIEERFIKSCASVVVVAEPIATWYRDRYKLPVVHVVRAIPSSKRPDNIERSRAILRRKHGIPENAIVFIYQGILARERGVDYLIKLFRESKTNHHLIFMGFGEAEDRILHAAKLDSRVHFQAAVPISEILQHTCVADIGLFVISGGVSESYRVSLPNKFFEYLFAGLPVLVSSNLEYLSDLINANDIGWVIDSDRDDSSFLNIDLKNYEEKRLAVEKYVTENGWEKERQVYRAVYC
jgi:glycosyltransferase involved in cell wall biosynthesis